MTVEFVTLKLPVTNLAAPAIVASDELTIIALASNEYVLAFTNEVNMPLAKAAAETLRGRYSIPAPIVFYLSHFKGFSTEPELGDLKGQLKKLIDDGVRHREDLKIDIQNFTPHNLRPDEPISKGSKIYMDFALEIKTCPICGNPMMPILNEWHGHFPAWNMLDQKTQMKRAGIHSVGAWSISKDGYICDVCAQQGLDNFTCNLCGEKRTMDLIQYQEGDPPDFLCKICYGSVPAKVWVDKLAQLDERHRYDNE